MWDLYTREADPLTGALEDVVANWEGNWKVYTDQI